MVIQDKAWTWKDGLTLPAYRVGAAARYAQTSPQRVSYWLRGQGAAREATLPRQSDGRLLSYVELIEVAFVATMRDAGISLQKIRRAREYAQREWSSEHPFTEYRWQTNGVDLLVQLRDVDSGTDVSDLIVGNRYGQLGWNSLMTERFAQFDYESNLVVRWHPRGKDNCVIIDPRLRFGAPNAGGVITAFIRGRYEAGESLDDIEDDLGLTPKQTRDALFFEGIEDFAA